MKWSPVPPKHWSKDDYLCNVCFLEFMCNYQALFLDWVSGELCLVLGSATDFLHDLGQIGFFLSTICSIIHFPPTLNLSCRRGLWAFWNRTSPRCVYLASDRWGSDLLLWLLDSFLMQLITTCWKRWLAQDHLPWPMQPGGGYKTITSLVDFRQSWYLLHASIAELLMPAGKFYKHFSYLFSFSFFTAQTMPSCSVIITLGPVISVELLVGFVCSLVFSPSH